MWNHGISLLALLSIVFGVGGVTWFFEGFAFLRKKRLIENLETTKIGHLSPGLVEVKGVARWNEKNHAPISGTSSIYYTYKVEQWQHRHDGSSWMLIALGDSGENYFYLEDDTGRVLVDPVGAEISSPVSDSRNYAGYNELPQNLKLLIDKERNPLLRRIRSSKGELMFTETCIPTEQQIYILGTAESQSYSASGREPAAGEAVIRKGRELPLLYISSREEKEITTRMTKSAIKRLIGGPITVGICSFFIYFYYSFSLNYIKKPIEMSSLFKGWIIYGPPVAVVILFALGYRYYNFTKVLMRSQGD